MKRTKTHAEAKRAHKALQARRDALAGLRRGETVEIRLAKDAGGDTVLVRPLGTDEDPAHLLVLTLINRRLRIDWCIDKDGLHVGPRMLGVKDIFGVVFKVNGESLYEGRAL